MNKKRLAIFFFYDQDGIVRNFVLEYLMGLKTVAEKVAVVINGELTEESKDKLYLLVDYVYSRENKGFDVWAYKSMLYKLGWDYVCDFEELILCNFTCYGPVYPFCEMFGEMDERECDFWGVVKHPEQDTFLLPNNQGYIYEHIMSYFMVIKEKMLHSEHFRFYWENVPDIKSKTESTAYHETVFTKYFEDLGYVSDAYVDLAEYEGKCNNNSILMSAELLIKSRCPLVKRRAFFFPSYESLVNEEIVDRPDTILAYLKNSTDYNVDYIFEDIIQTQKISNFYYNMNMSHILTRGSTNVTAKAAFIYIISIEWLSELQKHFERIDSGVTLYLLYSDVLLEEVLNRCQASSNRKIIVKRIYAIQDCAVQSFFTQFVDKACEYEYLLLCLDYNILNFKLKLPLLDYIRYVYATLLAPIEDSLDLFEHFESEKFLGASFLIPPMHSGFYGATYSHNIYTKQAHTEIYEASSIKTPFDEVNPYNNVALCWIKADCLEKIKTDILNEQNEKLFINEDVSFFLPLIIQDCGYYSEGITTRDYAECNLTQNEFLRKNLINREIKENGTGSWYAASLIKEHKVREKVVEKYRCTKAEALKMEFSLKELGALIAKYPKDHRAYKKRQKMVAVPVVNEKSYFTYLRHVCIEDNRIVFYFMSQRELEGKIYIELNNRKYYARTEKTASRQEVRDYVKQYSNAYTGFFEIPIELCRGKKLVLRDQYDRTIWVKWASGPEYSIKELNRENLCIRLYEGEILFEDKELLIKTVAESECYSKEDKHIFMYLRSNKYKNRKELLLFGENLSCADNAFQLFKEAVKNGINAYYVVSEDIYCEMRKTEFINRLVIFNSKKHKEVFIKATKWIGSFSFGELRPGDDYVKDIHMNLIDSEWIFVPHGMTLGDRTVAMLHTYSWGTPSRTYTSCEKEAEAYRNVFGFPNVEGIGSPRMDKWYGKTGDANNVIVFFTWRLGFSKGRISLYGEFEDSDYFKTIPKLIETIRRKKPNANIYYVFHHEIVKANYHTVIERALSEYNVEFIYFNSAEGSRKFNEVFAVSKYLITDFSSVAYDFAYKEGSIPIYYLDEAFISHHYESNEKFFDNHLGYIARDLDELGNLIDTVAPTDEMIERRNRFFFAIDGENAKRVLERIRNDKCIPQFEQGATETKKKRLAIYFFYDKDGIVDEYVYYYLEKLGICVDKVIFVSNGVIKDSYMEKLRNANCEIIIRENIGFDSWAYKDAIESIGFDTIATEYDEVILNNFTNFGPIFDFREMFAKMDCINCDFWGHNRYKAQKNQLIDGMKAKDHLQSYFIVFRKRIIQSEDFKEYWATLKLPRTYSEAVKFHEIRCTDFFERKGYSSAEYMPFDKYKDRVTNAPVYYAYSQLVEDRSPLLKRKVFFVDGGKYSCPLQEEHSVIELINYIKSHTEYNVSYIESNIDRTQDYTGCCDAYDEMSIKRYLKDAIEHDNKYWILRNTLFNKEEFVNAFK